MAKLERKGDTIHIVGAIDEKDDFGDAAGEVSGPLTLNFFGATGLNSLGCRNLTQFMKSLGEREVAFVECPVFLVELFNVLPQLIGGHRYAHRVKSVFAPYECRKCKTQTEFLVATADVTMDARGMTPPVQRCTSCRTPMPMVGSADDYFVFLA